MSDCNKRTLLPLDCYIDCNSNDKDFILNELRREYGVALEGLNKQEKLHLIQMISTLLIERNYIKMGCRKNIFQIMDKISKQLLSSEWEGLLAALIDGVLYQEFKRDRDERELT